MEPLYRVQSRALSDPKAAQECAERYAFNARTAIGVSFSAKWQARIVRWYLAGLGGANRSAVLALSNYERPLRQAFNEGRELRKLLLKEDEKQVVRDGAGPSFAGTGM